MSLSAFATHVLDHQARSLLCRLDRLQPLSLTTPMVAAASITPRTQQAMASYLALRHQELRERTQAFVAWLEHEADAASAVNARRRMSSLKLQHDALLTQVDIFADALTQRAEHGYGVLLGGLDALAEDALDLFDDVGLRFPLMTYLQAGRGARIRRRGSRLPGGGRCPVSLIEIPRERMLGTSVSASLCHEVGHLAASTLELLEPLAADLRSNGASDRAWERWVRWLSESMADLYALALLGPIATLSLIDVIMLPRALAFRLDRHGVHPSPWIRVQLSCAFGQALYPHRQWEALRRLWLALYPASEALSHEPEFAPILRQLPEFVRRLLGHRPPRFAGRTLAEVLHRPDRSPDALRRLRDEWIDRPGLIPRTKPCLALAALGQAKLDGRISAHAEAELLHRLLRSWAHRRAMSPR